MTECVVCGTTDDSPEPVVFGEFPASMVKEAFLGFDHLTNRVTLCDGCHAVAEEKVMTNDA